MILFGQNKKHSSENFIFFVCVCIKWLQKLQKKLGKKCGIKTVEHYNEKENIIELWQKVSDLETQIKH